MDYEKLKEVIAKKIKENGREEITGPVLQMVLMAMVDSLGEVYPQTYTDEQKAQARANIDALSDYDGAITKEKLSAEVQAILNDVANKQNITDESLATIAKTIVGAINEVYNGELKDASIATSKIEDGAITEPKLDTDLVNVITSAVQPAELASAIATALASYVAKADIVDNTGSATDKVMSQHGVTEAINGVNDKVTELESKINVSLIPTNDNGSVELPNIDTVNKVLDLGSDAVICVGNKSYGKNEFPSDFNPRAIPFYAENSSTGAIKLVFNTESRKLYCIPSINTLSENEVLVGAFRLVSGSHTFIGANLPFEYTIDGKSLSDNLREEIGDVGEEVGGVREVIWQNWFIGAANDLSQIKIYNLQPNTHYRVYLPNTAWDMTGVTVTGAYLFQIGYGSGSTTSRIVGVPIGSTVAPFYDIKTPESFDYIYIAGRAASGAQVHFTIVDIEINSSIIYAIDRFSGSRNLSLDKTNRTVTISANGLRMVTPDKQFSLSGSQMVLGYDATSYPNGAWVLLRSVVQDVANGGTIQLNSTNVFYAKANSQDYYSNIPLFFTYYGDFIPAGILGNLLLQLEIEAGTDIPTQMRSYAFNSVYNETDIEAKCKAYSTLLNNSGVGETFVFMTDPHLMGGSNTFTETLFKNYVGLLQKYYNMLPVDWMICGGDWLNNNDYQASACWKLGYVDATMRKLFKHYYPMLGNHDTNYQGVISADDTSRGDLTHQTLGNLMFRENGNTYYKFKGNNTQFYVFDTQLDWDTTMNAYKWEQIDWFAKALISDNADHAVILQHMFYTSGTTVNPMAEHIQTIAGAYNSRSIVTLNGITYDFSGATGKIACVIAGHSHTDAIITTGVSVPVWLTTNMMDGNTPTFDLCLIDYTANEMKSIRVGTGSDRTMQLA